MKIPKIKMNKKHIEAETMTKSDESTVIVNQTNSKTDLNYELLLGEDALLSPVEFKDKGFDTFGRNELPPLAAIREEIADTLVNHSIEEAPTYRRELPLFEKENLVDETAQSSLDMSSQRIPTRM